MSDQSNVPSLLGEALLGAIRQAVREEIQTVLQTLQPNGTHTPTPLLTVEELAESLKVEKSWIYDRTRRRKNPIPHVRVGRYPRFKLNQVLAWLEAQKKN